VDYWCNFTSIIGTERGYRTLLRQDIFLRVPVRPIDFAGLRVLPPMATWRIKEKRLSCRSGHLVFFKICYLKWEQILRRILRVFKQLICKYNHTVSLGFEEFRSMSHATLVHPNKSLGCFQKLLHMTLIYLNIQSHETSLGEVNTPFQHIMPKY
jgi:hypothetical protein